MTVKLEPTPDSTLTIPPELIEKLGVKPGTEVLIREKDGSLELHFLTETVDLDLDDALIAKLAIQAHERNITFNEHINILLMDKLEAEELENSK